MLYFSHMPPSFEHTQMKELMEQNAELLKDNNNLLKKIHRNALFSFYARLVWYVLLLGLPFALYFYVLEPYFTALGASYETFSVGIQEIPGWKQFNDAMEAFRNNGE